MYHNPVGARYMHRVRRTEGNEAGTEQRTPTELEFPYSAQDEQMRVPLSVSSISMQMPPARRRMAYAGMQMLQVQLLQAPCTAPLSLPASGCTPMCWCPVQRSTL